MSAGPVRLSEHLYLVEDTCKVYLVTDGDKALAIDFGSGKVLEHLGTLGVTSLEWVLHTHYHRDQCQGDGKAVGAGAKVAAPEAERKFFEQASQLWAAGRIPSGILHGGNFAFASPCPFPRVWCPGKPFRGEATASRCWRRRARPPIRSRW